MDFQQGGDFTNQYRGTKRATEPFRPAFGTVYSRGMLVKTAAMDSQNYSDGATVVPTAAVAADRGVQGVVSEDWNGFDGTLGGPAPSASAGVSATALARGTQMLKTTWWGYHPSVLIDNTDATAQAIVNMLALQNSKATAGKAQGIAAAVALSAFGWAMLPAAGIGSSLGAGVNVAATQTITVATPAAGDQINVTLQVDYAGNPTNLINPGIAQTRTLQVVVGAAPTATTAAQQVVTAINNDPVLKLLYSAANVAGVITLTVLAKQFFVTWANAGFTTDNYAAFMYITTNGTVGNSLTVASNVTGAGGTTAVAGGGTFAGGTGYIGTCPVWIF